ncbi:MAG: ABC transporter permease subunit [Lachnospiraceae bacterium]
MTEKNNVPEVQDSEKDLEDKKQVKTRIRKQRIEAKKRQLQEQKEVERRLREVEAKKREREKEVCAPGYAISRIIAIMFVFMVLFPSMNPARVSGLIGNNISLFTSAVSYGSLTSGVGVGFRFNQITESSFYLVMAASIVLLLGILGICAANCVSLGNLKMKALSFKIEYISCVVCIAGLGLIFAAYHAMLSSPSTEFAQPMLPGAVILYAVVIGASLIVNIILNIMLPKYDKEMKYEMDSRFKLFILFLPFAVLAFIFCYLPLWGWRYAFVDYSLGDTLELSDWNNFKWFTYLFRNKQTASDIARVMTNTLAMSGLGILTSWIPMVFAILLTEITNTKYKKFIQTVTTIPNFISWILVYTVALAIFSTDGFINSFAKSMGWIEYGKNYMYGDNFTWLKMLAWGLWKGTGWSAIIYIAGISGIDRQLYEAATVDGANRFQRIMHVTLPGLLPTYMVMLLMAVAGCLSNGLDQYLVFSNPSNMQHMNVLDLYVYNLGIGEDGAGNIPLSTVIGMAKSIISVVLLFLANTISKVTRGESIV